MIIIFSSILFFLLKKHENNFELFFVLFLGICSASTILRAFVATFIIYRFLYLRGLVLASKKNTIDMYGDWIARYCVEHPTYYLEYLANIDICVNSFFGFQNTVLMLALLNI